MKKVLAIIPAYNESINLSKVVNDISTAASFVDYLIINDGSSDDTVKICEREEYNYIDLPVNLGLTGAVHAGMKYAYTHNYDMVIQIDGDGQHNAEYIEPMLKAMRENEADVVIGSRFIKNKKPMTSRMIGSRIITAAVWLTTGKYIADVTSGMRLYNRKVMKKYAKGVNYRPEPDTMAFLINHGYKIIEVQVDMEERAQGQSYLSFINATSYMLHVLFNILVFQWVRKA